MKKLNILIISSVLPYPLNNGGAQAQFHIIDNLRDRANISMLVIIHKNMNTQENLEALKLVWPDVTFIPFYSDWKDYDFITILNKIKLKITSIFGLKTDQSKRLGEMSGDFYTDKFLTFVQNNVNENHYDIIQTEFYPFMGLIYSINSKAKKIFIQHEINFVKNEILMDIYPASKYEQYLYNKNRLFEIATMNEYDAIVALTEVDRLKLIESGVSTQIYSSPGGIKVNAIENLDFEFNNKIVFLGGYQHYPNADAVDWYLSDIWEKTLLKNPLLELHIVGIWPKNIIKNYEKKYRKVFFHGFVPDLSEILSNSIVIVPLRIGSGMRMKIIEAVNYACPVVTTSVGVEGLDFMDGVDCIIRDEPDSLAIEIAELSLNPIKQKELIQNAKNTFDENYSIDKLSQKRFSIYNSLIN
ncbi:glycosyltransferase [Flavobacterium sp. 2]|uniref:glycosyltransferase n=1 Tax=Flavobacterium sp. 2 TaxID=308053 RepID=UPI003CEFC978